VKRLSVLCFGFASLFFAATMQAQQIDAQFGISGLHSASASNSTSTTNAPQSLTGGVYPVFAVDAIFLHNLGLNGEVAWRATQGNYQDVVNYRPIFYDFNAVYARKITRVGFALMGGIGAESTRFYVAPSCGAGCTNFVSSNHFAGHLGAALRLYVTPSIYVAPEIHQYFVHNNEDFTSGHVTRYALNIGVTLGR